MRWSLNKQVFFVSKILKNRRWSWWCFKINNKTVSSLIRCVICCQHTYIFILISLLAMWCVYLVSDDRKFKRKISWWRKRNQKFSHFVILFCWCNNCVISCVSLSHKNFLKCDKSLFKMSVGPQEFNLIFLFLSGNNILEGTITRTLIKMAINLSLIIIS